MIAKPYFMKNPEWYTVEYWYNSKTGKTKYKLTDKAPPEAVESYKEFMKQMNDKGTPVYKDGKIVDWEFTDYQSLDDKVFKTRFGGFFIAHEKETYSI